jgi:hypothetical protein
MTAEPQDVAPNSGEMGDNMTSRDDDDESGEESGLGNSDAGDESEGSHENDNYNSAEAGLVN